MTDASLFDRLAETLRHPWATQAFTFASVVFLIAAWQIHGQGDVYNRLWLSQLFAGIGVGYFLLRAWAGGAHRWLARKSRIGVRRARRVEISVSGSDVAVVAVATFVVVSGFVAVVAVDSPNSPIGTSAAASTEWTYSDDSSIRGVDVNPATGNVYAITSGSVVGLNPDGTTIFDVSKSWTGNPEDIQYNEVTDEIIVSGGDLSNGYVYAISPSDGSTVWSKTTGRRFLGLGIDQSTGAIYAGREYDGTDGGRLYKYNKDGTQQWTYDTGSNQLTGVTFDPESGYVVALARGGYVEHVSTSGSGQGSNTLAGSNWGYAESMNGHVYLGSSGNISKVDSSLTEVKRASHGGGLGELHTAHGYIGWTTSNTNHVVAWNESLGEVYNYTLTSSSSTDGTLGSAIVKDGGNLYHYGGTNANTVEKVKTDVTFSTGSASDSSSHTHTFVLDDNTGHFQDDPELAVDALDADSPTISEDDWSHVATKSFNFEHEASVDVDEDTLHRLTVRDGSATYQEIGFRPVDEPNPYNLTIGTATATPTPTPTGNASDYCTLTETTDGGLDVTCAFPDPVSSYDYSLAGPNGSLYNGSLEFDEPTDYYQGEFSENFTESNLTTGDTSLDDLDVTWDGTYANGTSFNGSTSLFGGSDGSGGFSFGGPTGKSGGGSGGLQQAGGIALLAGAAILGYRRISDQSLTQAASGVAGTASSAAGRVASAASSAVGRLRGGGRG